MEEHWSATNKGIFCIGWSNGMILSIAKDEIEAKTAPLPMIVRGTFTGIVFGIVTLGLGLITPKPIRPLVPWVLSVISVTGLSNYFVNSMLRKFQKVNALDDSSIYARK